MDSILKNLRMKIIAWILAVTALVVIGILIENKTEEKLNAPGQVKQNDHDFDDILKDF